MKLYNTTKIVKFLLEEYPEMRDDDYLLWLAVIERTTTDDVALNITVGEFLKLAKYMKIPPYISVARASLERFFLSDWGQWLSYNRGEYIIDRCKGKIKH